MDSFLGFFIILILLALVVFTYIKSSELEEESTSNNFIVYLFAGLFILFILCFFYFKIFTQLQVER